MSEALLVLNPRDIPECMAALKSLTIDTCWFSYMTEAHLAPHLNAMIAQTNYDRYVVVSDDTSPTHAALDKVLEIHSAVGCCVTGYSNLDSTNRHVNLSRKPLHAPPPTIEAYDFLTPEDVNAYGDHVLPSAFAGFSLTCMSRFEWLKYAYEVSAFGAQTDYMLSWRLQGAGVPIVSHRDAYVKHVKETWNTADRAKEKLLLVGALPPAINWTKNA